MKTGRRTSVLVLAVAVAAFGLTSALRLPAETARWSIQVARVDPGTTSLPPSFQVAIYENVLDRLAKSKRFNRVLRDGEADGSDAANVLMLKTTCEKYSPGSETRRAVTTITGATKLTVRAQLITPDGKVVLERSIHGNVRFFGSNLRATQNLARNLVKTLKKSPVPQPPVLSQAMRPRSSDDIVVVEFR